MFGARKACARLSTHFNLLRTRSFCSTIKDINNNTKNNNNNKDNVDGKIESNVTVSTYNESYRQLDNLDFTTAARILFTQPSSKKKFGYFFCSSWLYFLNSLNGFWVGPFLWHIILVWVVFDISSNMFPSLVFGLFLMKTDA